jgi:hypothetical protein
LKNKKNSELSFREDFCTTILSSGQQFSFFFTSLISHNP